MLPVIAVPSAVTMIRTKPTMTQMTVTATSRRAAVTTTTSTTTTRMAQEALGEFESPPEWTRRAAIGGGVLSAVSLFETREPKRDS